MISVCIPTYNGEKYIKQQLLSILTQLSDEDEVIISDDSSTDSTLSEIFSLNDKRIHVLENNHFKSPIFNLENSLRNASGDYIFLSDQDDVWYDNKVEKMMDLLGNNDCVLSNATVVDKNLNPLGFTLFDINKSKPGFWHNIKKNGYTGCCMAFKRRVLDYALPFPKDIPMHDSWIGLISEKHGKVAFLKDELIYYRRHGNNASATAEKSKNSLIKKLSFRLFLIKNVFIR